MQKSCSLLGKRNTHNATKGNKQNHFLCTQLNLCIPKDTRLPARHISECCGHWSVSLLNWQVELSEDPLREWLHQPTKKNLLKVLFEETPNYQVPLQVKDNKISYPNTHKWTIFPILQSTEIMSLKQISVQILMTFLRKLLVLSSRPL